MDPIQDILTQKLKKQKCTHKSFSLYWIHSDKWNFLGFDVQHDLNTQSKSLLLKLKCLFGLICNIYCKHTWKSPSYLKATQGTCCVCLTWETGFLSSIFALHVESIAAFIYHLSLSLFCQAFCLLSFHPWDVCRCASRARARVHKAMWSYRAVYISDLYDSHCLQLWKTEPVLWDSR